MARRRAIVVTTWRSGSTFVGEFLASHPTAFYHYEPMSGHQVKRLRTHDERRLSTNMIRTLLNCQFKPHIGKLYSLVFVLPYQ